MLADLAKTSADFSALASWALAAVAGALASRIRCRNQHQMSEARVVKPYSACESLTGAKLLGARKALATTSCVAHPN